MKIGIVGAAGRMGRMNIQEVLSHPKAELGAALEGKGNPTLGKDVATIIGQVEDTGVKVTDDLKKFVESVDAIIDFSSPEATVSLASIAAENNVIHIIGTTGLDIGQEQKLRNYAKNTRIVYAPNFSIGVNVVMAVTEKLAMILDEEYDIEILEMHHNKKVDSPSGTALGLGKSAAAGRNVPLDGVWCKSRDGQTGARKKGEIGFATLRGGDVVGDHTAMFAADGERVEISHKASNRTIFSKGALRAALWAKNQKNGLYNMQDVLDL